MVGARPRAERARRPRRRPHRRLRRGARAWASSARAEGYVHPDACGRGIGRLIATGLEEDAARRGARRIQNSVLEADAAARRLLESLGYGAVRVFREMRIELEAPPPAPEWPDGLRVVAFDPERDALEFHAAQPGGVRRSLGPHAARLRVVVEAAPRERALRPDALVRRPRRRRDRRRDDLHGRHVRRRLGPRALHAPPVAQAGRGRSAPRRRVRALLGSAASTASGSASTRRTTPAPSASTSAPGWRPRSAGWSTRRRSATLRPRRHASVG